MSHFKKWAILIKKLHRNGAGDGIISTIPTYLVKGLIWLSSIFLIFIAFFIFIDIFTRFSFNHPLRGATEVVELAMACLVFLAILYTTTRNGHVRVEILVSHFSNNVKKVLDLLWKLVMAGLCGMVSWQLALGALYWINANRHTSSLNVPLGPFKCLGSLTFCLMFLILLINSYLSFKKQLIKNIN